MNKKPRSALLYPYLKKYCVGLGIDLFGVADISGIEQDFLFSDKLKGKFHRAVSLGIRLSDSVLQEIESAPTKLYFHHYRTVNAFLDQAAFKVSHKIESLGYQALPVPASQIVDWQKQNAHASHKKIAVSAGLGWIGRNNLLVSPKIGSRLRLVSILTDMPLAVDKPQKQDCGSCRACIAVCPCAAIKNTPEEFDHMRCFEQLQSFQKQRLVDQYICGICVSACRGKR